MTTSLLQRILKIVWRGPCVRNIALTLIYATALTLSFWAAYELRFDFEVPERWQTNRWLVLPAVITIKILCLLAFRQFDGLLSYFSTPDLRRLLLGCCAGSAALIAVRLVFGVEFAPPRGAILSDFVLSVGLLCSTRLAFRYARRHHLAPPIPAGRRRRRVAIVGADDCGATLARELLGKPWLGLDPVAFFDDTRSTSSSVHGIQVLGRPERIFELKSALCIEEVIIATPTAPARRIRDIVKLSQNAGLLCKTVPALEQLATGTVSVTRLRPVEIQDLLGREPVEISRESIQALIKGRTVMVTGAGGSIGSELCRQIASFRPAELLLVERSEPQLFVIEQELHDTPHCAPIVPLVGDIGNRTRMREIFRQFQPQLVFHAAAHKHVPMMELQPDEAIRNNILGTEVLATLAMEHAVERFVFISTDKAVNPTSVMGATKRFAEMFLQSLQTRSQRTRFMAVRFGNVLGSSGSVVPTFARQIAAGGPVTVTHPEITRYFMTIPEAVSLVLQSAAFGKAGQIFILDMGRPVKIVDLASQMIALSGFQPHDDIEIAFTGLRPGEKLHEELSLGHEHVHQTEHPKIRWITSPPQHFEYVRAYLDDLTAAIADGTSGAQDLKQLLAQVIPEYTPFVPEPAAAPAREEEQPIPLQLLPGIAATMSP